MSFKRLLPVLATLLVAGSLANPAFAAGLKAKPFEFDPDATGIVTAAWVAGEGLPDAGGSNHALFVQKEGLTPTNASAGAVIFGEEGSTFTELGFDIRNDGHCGAGAPRFNVRTSDNVLHFLGCAHGTTSPAPADPANWTRLRFTGAEAFPPIAPGSTVQSISIVFDEGTDQGEGFAYLDNIDINGTLIGKPGAAQ